MDEECDEVLEELEPELFEPECPEPAVPLCPLPEEPSLNDIIRNH